MTPDILIVPGYHGSGEHHWQTWLESQLPNTRRVTGVDWEKPAIKSWSKSIEREVESRDNSVIIVAHSFGCLASAMAIPRVRHKIAGCIFVAPADPSRFTLFGPRNQDTDIGQSVAQYLPETNLGQLGLMIGSANDPWMKLSHAYAWAERWGLAFYNAGYAGHINVESGHGEWPFIKVVTRTFCNLASQNGLIQSEFGHIYDEPLDQIKAS